MLTLDCETKADRRLLEVYNSNLSAPKNYKDEEKIKEWFAIKKLESEKALAIDPDYAEIACIGVKEDDEPARIVALKELSALFAKHKTLVTFNGKGFDLPVLVKTGVKQKLDLPYKDLRVYSKKWQAEQHIDLMEFISNGADWKSLDEYLQIYLGVKKTPIDFATATQEELEKHCTEDVENTYKLYKLFERSI